MSRDRSYLLDMIEAAKAAICYIDKLSEEEFFENDIYISAVIRQLEVIGEAARRLSSEFKSLHNEIQWRKVIELRNKLIHEYDTVDVETLWEVVKYDLPDLIDKLKKLS